MAARWKICAAGGCWGALQRLVGFSDTCCCKGWPSKHAAISGYWDVPVVPVMAVPWQKEPKAGVVLLLLAHCGLKLQPVFLRAQSPASLPGHTPACTCPCTANRCQAAMQLLLRHVAALAGAHVAGQPLQKPAVQITCTCMSQLTRDYMPCHCLRLTRQYRPGRPPRPAQQAQASPTQRQGRT